MHLFQTAKDAIIEALSNAVKAGDLPETAKEGNLAAITAEPPRDSSHGDIATNIAMVLAKPAGMNPRAFAEKLLPHLNHWDTLEKAEIAGPGFINLTLKPQALYALIPAIMDAGIGYGNSQIGNGQRVNVEYVSANPTGPMHIGHARGAIVGDVIAMLLIKTGHDVTKEYYINDAGAQVDILARSAHLRYRQQCGEAIDAIPEGFYPGEYLVDVAENFYSRWGNAYQHVPEEEWLPVLRDFALECMMALIRADLEALGVAHDVFTSEAAIARSGAIAKTIERLNQKGLVYRGVLEPPKGTQPEDWEAREQLLFKSTSYGDDMDRALEKSNGTHTYFAADVAYLQHKLDRGFTALVLGLGADHGGYVKRMKAATDALSESKVGIDILLHQLVNLTDNGQPVKMSKRAGTFVTAREVVDAVGKDVLRFLMLTRKAEATLDFDLKLAKEQSRDNPVFYVQYAHARIYSVIRNAHTAMADLKTRDLHRADEHFHLLSAPEELALLKKMAEWPRIVEAAALHREPHRVTYYLTELAEQFHQLWHSGNANPDLRFIREDDLNLTHARLALIKACATTIASGLQVMGVEPVMQM